jgi:hypothetical protein
MVCVLGFVQTHRFERLDVVAVHDRRQQCIRHACGVQDPPRIFDQMYGWHFEQRFLIVFHEHMTENKIILSILLLL